MIHLESLRYVTRPTADGLWVLTLCSLLLPTWERARVSLNPKRQGQSRGPFVTWIAYWGGSRLFQPMAELPWPLCKEPYLPARSLESSEADHRLWVSQAGIHKAAAHTGSGSTGVPLTQPGHGPGGGND